MPSAISNPKPASQNQPLTSSLQTVAKNTTKAAAIPKSSANAFCPPAPPWPPPALDHRAPGFYVLPVITPKHVRDALTATPFKPFRLFISDGSAHEILHPELAWLLGNRVFIGIPNGDPNDYSVKQLSILHLTR